jgi:hypothetical protein
MPTYECDNCNYSTLIKTHYNKHLNTQKHLNNMDKLDDNLLKKLSNNTNDSQMTHYDSQMTHYDSQMTHYDSQIITNSDEQIIKCKYCNKSFTRFNNLNRHIKTYCKIRKENDKRIMDIENKYKEELEIKKKETDFYKGEIENLQKRIGELIDKNRTTIINIDKQINLNSYGNEDMSHITEKFKDQMLKIPFVAIPKMIEEVHFSDKKPENKNIKLTNKKENYVKVYQNDKWIFKDKKATIKQLMDEKYTIIDNHYEESKEEPIPKPKHVESQFDKFKEMYNNGDKDLHNEIRVDCDLLLLNNMET